MEKMSKVPTESSDTRKVMKKVNTNKIEEKRSNTKSVTKKKINNNKIEEKKPSIKPKTKPKPISQLKTQTTTIHSNKCPCSVNQLLAIVIPISFVQLFMVIFLSVYLTKNKKKEKIINNTDDNITSISINETYEEYDKFTTIVTNLSFATLTPKNGYDHIYIHLGGISEFAGFYSDFFVSNKTFIPKGTKIYYLSGKPSIIKFMENDILLKYIPVPNWFNVDTNGNLICDDCNGDQFYQAKESLNYILDRIDQISREENIDYDKIYLGGFSQGGIMTNYVLLNSRHRLGGYLAFSGYVFDHHFPPNTVVTELNAEQKQILESRKDYHILAAHSFNDDTVFYEQIIEGYYVYYKDYTDFTLLSFGELGHEFDTQPTHPLVRKWLKESMGK